MRKPLPGSGLRPGLEAELKALADPGLAAGRVLSQHRGRWLVAVEEAPGWAPRLLPARGRLREASPVTGDWVAVDDAGAIAAVLPRQRVLERRDPGESLAAQTLAANVDLALIVEALPTPNERRAERFAALATAGKVAVTLVLTKADLDPDAHLTAARLRRSLDFDEALAVSARDGDGIESLRSLLVPEATTVLLGASGAGKSTLVNTLLGEERQATASVREKDGRGRHTTVTRELIEMASGALLLDTPGLREVELWDGGGEAFGDIERLAAKCRFGDCRHLDEPECAVRDGVDPDRLAAWRKLSREQARLDDRRAASRECEQAGRTMSRRAEEARRSKGRER